MVNQMLSQNIEIENLNKQLEQVNKDIETIQNDIKESLNFVKLRELHLEEKKNLKTSLEKRLENLMKGDNSLSSFLDDEKVAKRDNAFVITETKMVNNNTRINQYNEQLKETKNIFKKADLTIQRKTVEIHNKLLNRKNVRIERNQRMYIAVSRKVEEVKNKPLNKKVSINNIKLVKIQDKYETKIERTHELEDYKNQLQSEGHKIRSRVLGKVVDFYNKRDDRVRLKFQKLLATKSELLKIESARQFYESYDFTRNQQRVLDGEKLKYNDIIQNIVQDNEGNYYYQDAMGNQTIMSPEQMAKLDEKFNLNLQEEKPKGKVA